MTKLFWLTYLFLFAITVCPIFAEPPVDLKAVEIAKRQASHLVETLEANTQSILRNSGRISVLEGEVKMNSAIIFNAGIAVCLLTALAACVALIGQIKGTARCLNRIDKK